MVLSVEEKRLRKNERSRVYRENNIEKERERNKVYDKTPNGKKRRTKSDWKSSGLHDSDNDKYDQLYEKYLQSTNCDVCKNLYVGTFDRCMDRDHDTNLFRQFLCQPCNRFDNWKKVLASQFDVRIEVDRL
jgi:hypothetical protein